MVDSAHLVSKYQAILNSNGQSNQIVSGVTVTVPSQLEGEYQGSSCTYVTLHLANGNDVDLFVKETPANPEHAKVLRFSCLFEKEAGFFNQILPDMRKLYIEKSLEGVIRPLNFVPKCYLADNKEIVLENLARKGYIMYPKADRQGLSQAKMVLLNLATFHALGYSMVCELGEDAFLKKYPFVRGDGIYSTENKLMSVMTEIAASVCEKLLMRNNVPGGERALEIIRKYKGRVFSELIDLIDPEKSFHLYKILNHGDVWNNNLLFLKNVGSDELVHNMLVDYQTLRYGSPNLDLTYYFFSSLPYEIRRKHWRQLLADYFETFTTTLDSILNGNNNNGSNHTLTFKYSFEEFVEDFKGKSFIGFWLNIMYWLGAQLKDNVDLTNMVGDMMTFYTNKVFTWMEQNPDKGVEVATGLVQFCEEFDELSPQ